MPGKAQEQDPRLTSLLRILHHGRLPPPLVARELGMGVSDAEVLLVSNSEAGGPLSVTMQGEVPWYGLRNPPLQGTESPREAYSGPLPPAELERRLELPLQSGAISPEPMVQQGQTAVIVDLLHKLRAPEAVIDAAVRGDYWPVRKYVRRAITEIAAQRGRLQLREARLADLVSKIE